MSDSLGRTAHCRVIYDHMVRGGALRSQDREYLIQTIEGKDKEIQLLESELRDEKEKVTYLKEITLYREATYGN